MGIREGLNSRPSITAAAAAVILLGAVAAIVWQFIGRVEGGSAGLVDRAWFTTDDGKSYFAEDAKKMPPFEHEGKTAYRCYVYTCDGGKTKFVPYIERYTAEAKKILEDRLNKRDAAPGPPPRELMAGIEVKLPGAPESAWVRMNDPRAAAIVTVKCPGGDQALPSIVRP